MVGKRERTKSKSKRKVEKPNELFEALNSKGSVVLFLTKGNALPPLIDALRVMNKSKIPGVFVTLNLPMSTIDNLLKKEKVDSHNLIFIDLVSVNDDSDTYGQKHISVNSPSNLTELSIAISQALTGLGGKSKFLLFYTLSTLQLYNHSDVIARFISFIIKKLREWDVTGIFFDIATPKSIELANKTKIFYDKVIKVEKPIGSLT